jgi:predicted transglutaminase-like cysteine proteinase
MKSLRYELLALVVTAALTLFASAQQPTGNPSSQSQGTQGMQGQMQSGQMQHGNMNQMMQDCHKNMQAIQQSNTRAKQDVEAAKQSNDPAKMRAALDEADQALTRVNDHINTCMNMMQGMHGKGMMSGQQTPSPKQ